MAPFSPLPAGYCPRSPKPMLVRSHPHLFGQITFRQLDTSIPHISHNTPSFTCNNDSKSWMTCLALSCLFVVLWLAALPDLPRSQVDMVLPELDLDEGAGMALMWVYDVPKPMIGYGRDITQFPRKRDDTPSLEASTPPVQPTPTSSVAAITSVSTHVTKQEPTPTSFSAHDYAGQPAAEKTDWPNSDESVASSTTSEDLVSTPSIQTPAERGSKEVRRSRIRRDPNARRLVPA